MAVNAQDTLETLAILGEARQLAGNDKYLLITQKLQCNEIGPDGRPIGPGKDTPNFSAEPTFKCLIMSIMWAAPGLVAG